jgi:hypothetical protein
MKKSAVSLGYLVLTTVPLSFLLQSAVLADDLELRGPMSVGPEAPKDAATQDAIDSMSPKQVDKLKKAEKTPGKKAFAFNFNSKKAGSDAIKGAQDVGAGAVKGAQTVGEGAVKGAQTVGEGAVKGAEVVGTGAVKSAQAVGAGAAKSAQAVGAGAVKGAEVVGTGAVKSAQAISEGAKIGAQAIGEGATKSAEAISNSAKAVADGAQKGAKAIGDGAKKGAEIISENAMKLGTGIRSSLAGSVKLFGFGRYHDDKNAAPADDKKPTATSAAPSATGTQQ